MPLGAAARRGVAGAPGAAVGRPVGHSRGCPSGRGVHLDGERCASVGQHAVRPDRGARRAAAALGAGLLGSRTAGPAMRRPTSPPYRAPRGGTDASPRSQRITDAGRTVRKPCPVRLERMYCLGHAGNRHSHGQGVDTLGRAAVRSTATWEAWTPGRRREATGPRRASAQGRRPGATPVRSEGPGEVSRSRGSGPSPWRGPPRGCARTPPRRPLRAGTRPPSRRPPPPRRRRRPPARC